MAASQHDLDPAALRALDPTCVWIFDGGPNTAVLPTNPTHASPVPQPTCVIAADSGLEHATALGFTPDVLVGDLDSVSEMAVRQWQEATAGAGIIEQHPPTKDLSDLELALEFASRLKPGRVVVLSGGAGRLDHVLTAMLCLAGWANNGLKLDAYVGNARVVPVTAGTKTSLDLTGDQVLTLLAVGGPARVNTTGLRWDLTEDHPLLPNSSRGLSNEPAADRSADRRPAEIHVAEGIVLAIIAERDAGHENSPSATSPTKTSPTTTKP